MSGSNFGRRPANPKAPQPGRTTSSGRHYPEVSPIGLVTPRVMGPPPKKTKPEEPKAVNDVAKAASAATVMRQTAQMVEVVGMAEVAAGTVGLQSAQQAPPRQ